MSGGKRATAIALALLALSACGGETTVGGQCPSDLPPSCPATVPSYQTEIMPLIGRVCTECHRTNGPVPNRPLDTYGSVYAQRQAVLTQVYGCRMPPAGAAALTTTERQQLLTWLVCQSPNN